MTRSILTPFEVTREGFNFKFLDVDREVALGGD